MSIDPTEHIKDPMARVLALLAMALCLGFRVAPELVALVAGLK